MAAHEHEASSALLGRAPARPETYERVSDDNGTIANVFRDTATDKYYWLDRHENKYKEISFSNDNIIVRGARSLTELAQHPRVFQVSMAATLTAFMYKSHSITKSGGSVPSQLRTIEDAIPQGETQALQDVHNMHEGYNHTVDFFQQSSIVLLISTLAYSLQTWVRSIHSNLPQLKKMNSVLLLLGAAASVGVVYFGACIPGSAIPSEAEFCTLRMERSLVDNNSALYPVANAGLTLLATLVASGSFKFGGMLVREENAVAAMSFARQVGGRAVMGVRSTLVSVRNAFTLNQGLQSLAIRVKRLEDNQAARARWVPPASAPPRSEA